LNAFRSLSAVLDAKARRDFVFLALFSTMAGFLETTSIGLIIPFIAAATNTGPFGGSRVWTNKWHDQLMALGISPEAYTPVLALFFLVGTLIANTTLVYYQYYALRVVYRERASLGTRLLNELTHKSLGWYEYQNSKELSKSVLTDVERVILSLASLAQLTGIGIRVFILALFFMLAQLRLAIALACGLFLAFFLVFRFIHRPLTAAGQQSLTAVEDMYGLAGDVFNGIREVKVSRTEDHFVNRFRTAADSTVQPEVVRGMPPHVTRMGLETLILTLIMLVLVYFHRRDGNLANGLPILSAYAVAGIRLLPSLQQALFHWVQIRFLAPSVYRVEELLQPEQSRVSPESKKSMAFEQEICLNDVCFAYPGSTATLSNMSLTIHKNERVAFVGSTGAGKSTLMDLLLGLRTPSGGSILVDGQKLEPESVASWLSQVGYVPQSVYLLDASVRENVAFGVAPAAIDPLKVEQACRAANIHDFIVTELSQGYDTFIGERGIRLSGGQCQRLSIARALYHDPAVVFFDEATSALDNATEDSILRALDGLRGRKTLIVVAHRLHTVWDFDTLFVLDKGQLVGAGKAEDLLTTCSSFRNLVRQSPDDVEKPSDSPG
jgi:ABC-type multidrug transport system fused ATPase/permease subunit